MAVLSLTLHRLVLAVFSLFRDFAPIPMCMGKTKQPISALFMWQLVSEAAQQGAGLLATFTANHKFVII